MAAIPLTSRTGHPAGFAALIGAPVVATRTDSPVPLGGEALADRLRPTLQEHTTSQNYNSFAGFLSFLGQQEGSPGDVQALLEFRPDAMTEVQAQGGSACVGLALDLAHRLKLEGYPAWCCPVRLPQEMRQDNQLEFGHLAVVIPFSNPDCSQDHGYLMMDPGLSLTEPIPVRPGLPLVMAPWDGRQLWTFNYPEDDSKVVTCDVTIPNSQGGGRSEFLVGQEWLNPDTLSKCLPFNRRPRLTIRDDQGETVASVAVESLRNKTVVMVESEGQRSRVPVSEQEKVGALIDDEVARRLLPLSQHPRQELLRGIFLIAQAMPDLAAMKDSILESSRLAPGPAF